MKYLSLLAALFFFSIFGTFSFGQVDTAHLVVETYCPDAYPIIGDSIDVVVKVTNDGGATSEAKPLFFFQRNFFYPNYEAVIYLGDSIDVPALGVNESITLEKRFPTGELPGLYNPNGEYGTVGKEVLEYGFAFYKSPWSWGTPIEETSLDFYCKKFDTDLAIEVSSLDETYDASGVIHYTVEFTNNGAEKAYNVVVNLYDNLGRFSIYYSALDYFDVVSDMPLKVFAPQHGTVSVKVDVDSLEVGETKSIDVTFEFPIFSFNGQPVNMPSWLDYHQVIPLEQRVIVAISSGHNINTIVENDTSTLVFNYVRKGCSDIPSYTKIDTLGGHGYYLSDDMATWESADTLAQNDGGYLSAVTSLVENNLIQGGLDTLQAFIGLNDAASEGDLQWANNEIVTLDLSYGNSIENDFGMMDYWSGDWQMVKNQVEKHWILEKECEIPVCPEGLFLWGQHDVDLFPVLFPDCKHIPKSVVVVGANSLVGLSNIESIGEGLSIKNCDSLASLEGLEHLETVGGEVDIEYNKQLLTLNGLNHLKAIGGRLKIYNNDTIMNLVGLDSLASIGGVFLLNSTSLINVNGLQNLKTIGGDLSIEKNKKIQNLDSLEHLISIHGYLLIDRNDVLSDISGLRNIDPESIHRNTTYGKDLVIVDNPMLSICEIESICGFLDIPGRLKSIYDNASGCNSVSEVVDACDALVANAELSLGDNISLSPSPASESITVRWGAAPLFNGLLVILDARGKTVLSEKIQQGQSEITLDIANLPKGLYFLKLGQMAGIQRFVKMD